jgi:electron transfer flavoprotein beta subunit
MKLMVTVKRVVDYNIKVRPNSDNTDVEKQNLKMSMNPFDEIAVEEAIRLKESGLASEVVVVSIGVKQCMETIRTALAMGADRGILVETDQEVQPLEVAKLLQKISQAESPDMVIMGKQAIDDDSNQCGQMLAALLGWGQGTFACGLKVKSGEAVVEREIDGGTQTIALNLPAVVTADLRLNEPRYVKLPNIMKAKKKPVQTLTPEQLQVDVSPRIRLISAAEPPQRKMGIKVSDARELVAKLKTEAQVI